MGNETREKLGVAIVGTGYWGVNYVRVLGELPQVRSVTVIDQRPGRLDEVRHRFPSVVTYTDIEQGLASADVDVVVVSTPATTHYDVTRRCLESGKHVLVEKPITTRVSEAEELIQLADARGLTLMVGHTFLYNPGVKKIKDFIQQGQLGQMYYLYAQRTNLGPIRNDVNAIWDLAPHDVSIFNYFLGASPTWVTAVGMKLLQPCCEDFGFIVLGYGDGTIGHIHVSWADPSKVRRVVVVGSEKRAVFDDVNTSEPVRVFEKGVMRAQDEASTYGEHAFQIHDGDIVSPKVEVSEPLKNQCRHFLDCVIQGHRPVTDGAVGLEVVKVMAAIDRSLELGGSPVLVEDSPAAVPLAYDARPVAFAHNGTPVRVAVGRGNEVPIASDIQYR